MMSSRNVSRDRKRPRTDRQNRNTNQVSNHSRNHKEIVDPSKGYVQLVDNNKSTKNQSNHPNNATEHNKVTCNPNSHQHAINNCRTQKSNCLPDSSKTNTTENVRKRKLPRSRSRRRHNTHNQSRPNKALNPTVPKPPEVQTSKKQSQAEIMLIEEMKKKEEKLQKEKIEAKANDIYQNNVEQLLDTDLTCLICRDVYINPMLIDCSHSFCKFCIYQWLDKKSACPTCRKPVKFIAENLALKNIVYKMITKASQKFQDQREEFVGRRATDEEKQAKKGIKGLRKNRANDDHDSHNPSIGLAILSYPIHEVSIPQDRHEEIGQVEREISDDEILQYDFDEDDDDDTDNDNEFQEDEAETSFESYESSFYGLFNPGANEISDETEESEESEELETSNEQFLDSSDSANETINIETSSEDTSMGSDEFRESTDEEELDYSSNASSLHVEDERDEDDYFDEHEDGSEEEEEEGEEEEEEEEDEWDDEDADDGESDSYHVHDWDYYDK